MSSLRSFASKMRKASKAVLTNSDKLVIAVAEKILATVVTDTPIDTGQAKSNWLVAINIAPSGIRGPYVPGKKGSTSAENIIATAEMGFQQLTAYKSGSEIHITNNLDYISDLNEGWSKQAPPDYVQLAILQALSVIKQEGFTILHDIEVYHE